MERISTINAVEIFGDSAIPLLETKLKSLRGKIELKEEVLKAREALYKLKLKAFLKFNPVPFSKVSLIEPLFKSVKAKDLFKLNEELRNLKRERRRIRFALKSTRQWIETGEIDCLDVDGAKKYPIERLIRGKIKGKGKVKYAFCPFHEETNPSFCIYTKTNSFYCFSCKRGGDVISLTQELKGLNFKDAVRYLS